MSANENNGIVYLVGAGPGDPGLMTLRGHQLICQAEVIVHDYLANPEILADAPELCEMIYVGKQANNHTMKQEDINALLVQKCLAGKFIVRLKGGDPFVFGRGGEEALALKQAGCRFEIVPGITSGIAAPAYAGIPVTQRGMSTSLGIITAHEAPGKQESDLNWEALSAAFGTLVFYMGVGNLPIISEQLIKHGRSPETPVALVHWGTWAKQETLVGTLDNIVQKANDANLKPPAIIVVGEVVNLREELAWFETTLEQGRKFERPQKATEYERSQS